MSEISYLNLDELATVERTLHFKGEDHPQQELSVEGFIALTRELQDYEVREEELSIRERIEMLAKIVASNFPTLGLARARAMTLRQLLAVVSFMRQAEEEVAGAAEDGGEKKSA